MERRLSEPRAPKRPALGHRGYDGHRGWLYTVAVRPDVQRRGIGRALVQRAEESLAALGCPKVNLQVMTSNAAVVGFYERLGYGVEERISMGKSLRIRSP